MPEQSPPPRKPRTLTDEDIEVRRKTPLRPPSREQGSPEADDAHVPTPPTDAD